MAFERTQFIVKSQYQTHTKSYFVIIEIEMEVK